MLVYSESRVVPAAINIITLEGEGGGFFYVHRTVYDQAVILTDLFGASPDSLRQLIMGETKQPAVEFYLKNAPEPINILGPFIDLVTGNGTIDSDLEEISGVLHVMSMCINFRKILKVDAKLRQSVRFSLSIKGEYQILWDRFFAEATEYGQTSYTRNYTQRSYSNRNEDSDTESSEEDFLSKLSKISANFDISPNNEDEEDEPNEKEESKEKSGIDLIMNW
jgi:hypothetical protein